MQLPSRMDPLQLSAVTAADRAQLARIADEIHWIDKLAALRAVLVGALAVLSAPLWLIAALPHRFPQVAHHVQALWVLAVASYAAAFIAGRLAVRRLAKCTTRATQTVRDARREEG